MSQSQSERFCTSSKLIILLTILLVTSSGAFAQISTTNLAIISKAPAAVVRAVSMSGSPGADTTGSGNSSAKMDAKKPSGETDADRLNALEEAIRAQNVKIEKMNQIIAEQQQTIQQLSGKSNGVNAAGQTESVASVIPPSDSAENSGGSATQTQTLDERVKKVEDQVLKIGPVRFSGDFRLRFDGIFRKSEPTPPAGFSGTSLVQNVRARYRFRLNMDTDVSKTVSFHGQLATGPVNNPLTNDQDFSSSVARQPFFINEAWIDYHPNKSIDLQGGRLQEVFADNSRFLFDDDVRFNGFNEKYVLNLKDSPAGFTSIDFRAGQYIFSNPNVAIVAPGSPLAIAGAALGAIGRSSNLFHQGVLVNHKINKKFNQQFGVDLQLYRNPNQIQLASTANGAVLIVYPGLGLTLSGPLAGSTFANPLYQKWISEYGKAHPNVKIDYQSIGSGGGIKQIKERTIDYGATDSIMSDEDMKNAPGEILHIPVALGAVVLTYNLAGITQPLRFSPDVVADIFLGNIKKWDDPRIKADNPNVNLPSTDIAVVHRSDGSGTTGAFTDYLAKVSPDWKSKVGVGTSVQWAVGMGGKGNEGVTGQVKQTPNTIGYVELAYAVQNKLPAAIIKNKAENFVEPTFDSVTAAAAGSIGSTPDDLRVSITNADGANSYPISTYTYILPYKEQKDSAKGKALVDYLWWGIHDGQKYCRDLQYAPLPDEIVKRAEAKINSIA